MGRIATMRAVRRIGDAVSRTRPPRTSPYDASATVTAVDGGTAWVLLDGAGEPMPVTMTIDSRPGDRVRVRVSSSGAHVTGNATAPPTDDAEALAAKVRAQLAQESAVTAQETADTAQETADAAAERVEEVAASVKNYVWADDAGLHITQTEGAVENDDSNILLDSDSLDVRAGNSNRASYGANGAVIGSADTGQTVVGDGSLILTRNGYLVLSASDEGVIVGADGATVAQFTAENVTWATVSTPSLPLTWHASQPAQVAQVTMTIQPLLSSNRYVRLVSGGTQAGVVTLYPIADGYMSGKVIGLASASGYVALYSVEVSAIDQATDNVTVTFYVWGTCYEGQTPVAGEWASGYTTLNDLLDEITIGEFSGDMALDVFGTLTVNGSSVSLQGHTHAISDVTGLQTEIDTLWDGIDSKQDALTFDTVPTQDSTNPVESGGIYDALQSAGGRSAYYATCSTAASTAAKAITVAGWTPAAGDLLAVYFTTANTAATPTLSVNGTSYGMYVGSSTANSTTNVLKWSAYTTLLFAFDGTYFRHIASQSIGTANQPDGAGTWHGSCSTAAGTAAKTASATNFRLTPGAIVALTCTTANTVSGQITLNVSSTGAKVVYIGNAATSATNPLLWDAGDALLFVYATYWRFLGRAKTRVSQTVTTGTEIATVDGTPIYAPSGGGSGKVDAESTNGTDTAIIANASGAIEFAATDGTNDTLVDVGSSGFAIEATDGTDTSGITIEPGGVTISNSGIAASHVMITGSAGDIQTSSVTSTELYRLSGIASNVQNQIDALQSALDALDTWETVALSDFATIASGWTFVTNGCNIQFNAALRAVRVRLQVQTAAAQTAGSKTLFTVKAAYRPKTFPAAVPSITANAQTAQIWTTGGFSPVVAAISAGTNLQFNGVYFIGS